MASAASSKARSASRCMAFQKNRVEWQCLSLTSSVENTCPMPSEGQRRLGCSQEASAVDRAKLATAAEPVEPCGSLQRPAKLTPSNSRVTGLNGKLLNLTSANSVDSLMYPLPIYAQKMKALFRAGKYSIPIFFRSHSLLLQRLLKALCLCESRSVQVETDASAIFRNSRSSGQSSEAAAPPLLTWPESTVKASDRTCQDITRSKELSPCKEKCKLPALALCNVLRCPDTFSTPTSQGMSPRFPASTLRHTRAVLRWCDVEGPKAMQYDAWYGFIQSSLTSADSAEVYMLAFWSNNET